MTPHPTSPTTMICHRLLLFVVLSVLLFATRTPAQDRVIVSVKHVLGGVLNTRSIGLYTFDFEIREAFRQMNDLLERERLPWILELDEIEDVEGISQFFDVEESERSAFEDMAMADPSAYKWREDAINVYLVNSIEAAGGFCSFPHDSRHEEIVVIANGLFDGIANGSGGWLHEFGHYLSLLHTFQGGDSEDDCQGAGARHSQPPTGCPAGMDSQGTADYCYQLCPDSCPDDENIMSYNDLDVFFNLPGDFTDCQKRNMNYELYAADGSRSHVLFPCEQACAHERTTCLEDCEFPQEVCRGACGVTRSVCRTACPSTETCRGVCTAAFDVCKVGCDVFCFLAPNSEACRDCLGACESVRVGCNAACEATRTDCLGVCDDARALCDSACTRTDCDAACDSAEVACAGLCPEDPIGPPGMVVPRFRRGDANGDRRVDISDGNFILRYLFVSGAQLLCKDSADVNDSGVLDVSDAIRLFGFLFLGEDAPAAPGPATCGTDLTDDPFGCESAPAC